jgi:arginyl-tRNA synthetase
MYIRDLIDRALEYAAKTTKGRSLSYEDLHKIALGAIKFNDFAQDRKTNILFDWDRMFSLQGFSGPFVQYAAVRINSILTRMTVADRHPERAKRAEGSHLYTFQPEHKLLLKLSQFPQVVKTSAQKYEPHHIATYSFELAQELNRYYEEIHILSSEEETKQSRIWLLKFTRQVLKTALEILGIQIPTKM